MSRSTEANLHLRNLPTIVSGNATPSSNRVRHFNDYKQKKTIYISVDTVYKSPILKVHLTYYHSLF